MTRFVSLETRDIRFPTSVGLHGSDAMNPAPDYSAAYVVITTDAGDGHEGHGFVFTTGRGNDIQTVAIRALSSWVVGRDVEETLDGLGDLGRELTGDAQLRWLGPEKGVVHMAAGAVLNALWDLRAKRAGQPLWELLSGLSPEEIVDLVDFRYLSDALTRDEALGILRGAEPGRAARTAQLLSTGYPAYTTTPGWLGYDDEKLARLSVEAVEDGFRFIKLKVGRDLEEDVRRMAIARAAVGPDIAIAVDANQRWEVAEAIDWINKLSEFDPYWIEEPTSPDDVLGHAAIRAGVAPVLVATGEHVANRVVFKQMLAAGSLDILQIDATRVGARARPCARRSCCWRATGSSSSSRAAAPSPARSRPTTSPTSTTCGRCSSPARRARRAARPSRRRRPAAHDLRSPRRAPAARGRRSPARSRWNEELHALILEAAGSPRLTAALRAVGPSHAPSAPRSGSTSASAPCPRPAIASSSPPSPRATPSAPRRRCACTSWRRRTRLLEVTSQRRDDDSSHGPLTGIRVIEFGQLLAGPYVASLLGDFGADVVKVEAPPDGDPMREWGRHRHNGHTLWWPILSRNKRSVSLNLRTEEGQRIARELCAEADVVLENFKPGTMEKWGIGPEQVHDVNPGCIYARVSGYGQSGATATAPGFASGGEAMAGLRYINGYPGQAPPRCGISLGDTLAAQSASRASCSRCTPATPAARRARSSTRRSSTRASRCSSRRCPSTTSAASCASRAARCWPRSRPRTSTARATASGS